MPSGQFRKPAKPGHKWCTLCDVEKPYEDFNKNKNSTDGRASHCRPCRTAYNSEPSRLARQKERNAAYVLSEEQKRRRLEQSKAPHRAAKHRARMKERYHKDPSFRLRQRVANSIRKAMKGATKTSRTFDLLPYTPDELRAHLESLFVPGMTWENYGSAWHIDHHCPQYLFDMTIKDQVLMCWDLTNLRPLWKHLNLAKSFDHDYELPENWQDIPDYAK